MTLTTLIIKILPHCLQPPPHWTAPHKHAAFIVSKLYLGIAFSVPVIALADTPEKTNTATKFSTSFLQNGGAGVDLSDFLQGSSVVPGTYRVDLYINRSLVGRQDIVFAKQDKTGRVEACLTLPVLQSLELDMNALRQAGLLDDTQPEQCHDLPSLIELSSVEYDTGRQQLTIAVPQAAMLRSARGYVAPSLWDEGVTTGFISYDLTARRNTTHDRTANRYYVGLRNGINLGPWRLRNESNFTNGNNGGMKFSSDRTFAQRDITSLKSQLTVGAAYTDPKIFDSVRINGVLLNSDDAMLPDSQRGYAPIIRGDAETNATVEIRQNNYLMYSLNVPPGPFVIDDLYPNGSNGDLEITVIEADGRRRVTTQAFSSLPQMVRRGQLRQNLALGVYDSTTQDPISPKIAMATLAYGLTDNTTLFGGTQWSPDFSAWNLGATQNTVLGAFSADITQASSAAPDIRRQIQRNKGQSARVLYAKTLARTDTTFTLASYRYSTEGYRTLNEHLRDFGNNPQYRSSGRAKSRFDLSLSQSLGGREYGSLYLRLNEQRYWNLAGKTRQYTVGYSGNWGKLSYNLSATHSVNPVTYYGGNDSSRFSLTLSFPLGSGSNTTYARSTLTRDDNGVQSLSGGASGRIMGRNDAAWSVNASHESLNEKTFSGSVSGTTPVAQMNAGYTQGNNFTTFNAGASGSIVAHAGGINLGQSLSESFTLVEVPGVAGVAVGNNAGVTTGANGYAVVPNAQPYRTNWINLDSSQLGADIEIDNTTQQVIPRRGSVTVARFNVKQGRRVQFELVKADGTPMPFGARVENEQGTLLAIADPSGQALVMVESDKGVLKVKSGALVCEAGYVLPERANVQGYDQVKLVCR